MLLKILGAVDVLAGLILIITGIGFKFPQSILMFFGIFLLIKSSLGLWKDFASWTDIICGAVILISISSKIPLFVLMFLAAVIGQKGIFSFLD